MVRRLLGKGESVFFKCMTPGRSTTLPCLAAHPEVREQHKLEVMDYLQKRDVKLCGGWE